MKKCPFCGQDVPDDAVFCAYCGKPLERKDPVKWYYKPASLIVSFCVVGPLMLPLVWRNPAYSRNTKVVITAVVISLTIVLIWLSAETVKIFNRDISKAVNGYYF
jgi:uncharacterized membrane protein YvbJ